MINHSALGDALTRADPPVRATIVYNNNPVAVCPDSEKVIAGFSREDLFCVVMDSFLTDTADYADIVLPATTQLEHHDVHKSYGHLYVLGQQPGDRAGGRIAAELGSVQAPGRAHGIRRAVLSRQRRGHLRAGARIEQPAHARRRTGAR